MDKAFSLLGLAMRARKLQMGESVLKSVTKKSAKLVVIASDASLNTQKKLIDKCNFYKVDYVFIDSISLLSSSIGQYNVVSVAILDEGFGKKIAETLRK